MISRREKWRALERWTRLVRDDRSEAWVDPRFENLLADYIECQVALCVQETALSNYRVLLGC